MLNGNDTCHGTTTGLAVDANGCPTVAAIVAVSDDPADGGFDADDLTGMGLTGAVVANLADYEVAIANASPAPTTLTELQTLIDGVNQANDTDSDGVLNGNDTCPGTTTGLAVDASGCPTVAAIVAASNDPADGGFDADDLTGMGLTGVVVANLADYEVAIANASPVPTTLTELQTLNDTKGQPDE